MLELKFDSVIVVGIACEHINYYRVAQIALSTVCGLLCLLNAEGAPSDPNLLLFSPIA